MKVERLKIADIQQKENSRGNLDKTLASLMSSIQQNGLQQPIGVSVSANGKKYEIMYGNRRLNACMKLGWTTIPAVLYSDQSDKDILIHNLVENIQREGISPSEIGRIVENLMKMGLTKKEVSVRIGLPVTTIDSTLDVYQNFPEDLRKNVVFHKPGTKKYGKISVSAVSRVLNARNKFGLTKAGVRNLMEQAVVENMSGEDIQIIGSLMQSGETLSKSLVQRKQYRAYRISAFVLKDEVESLAKKAKCSPISYLTRIIYGIESPISKPEFIEVSRGAISTKE